MKTERQKTFELGQTIHSTLAELDLRGTDEQVTKAMTIVNEGFSLHMKGQPVTAEKLLAKAEKVGAECHPWTAVAKSRSLSSRCRSWWRKWYDGVRSTFGFGGV